MGTETFIVKLFEQFHKFTQVKLNNPLMGTETCRCPKLHHVHNHSSYVKLNNPLMGTETYSNERSIVLCIFQES